MTYSFSASPAVAKLIALAPLNELGPGQSQTTLVRQLRELSDQQLFAPAVIVDQQFALACRAGLLLLADDLDASHTISQDLHNATGSYWHGIMHRREPDDGNACYWFARVGQHPVYHQLAPAAASLARDLLAQQAWSRAEFLLTQTQWSSEKFVGLCSVARRGTPAQQALCQRIQRLEIELLLDYCYGLAIGS